MSLIRFATPTYSSAWSPFNRLASLHDEVSRLFDSSPSGRPEASRLTGWNPPLDLYDTKENLVVELEAPGLKQSDFTLSLHEGVLTISGERQHEAQSKATGSFRSERAFGKFQRSVVLPALVSGDAVTATYQDGLLTVTLPKAEEAKPRRIQVNAA